MPELPDVEAFKLLLEKSALHKAIDRVAVNDSRILGKLPSRTFVFRLEGAKLVDARRHGKHLMANLDRGGWLTLHFGMTGALQFVRSPGTEPPGPRKLAKKRVLFRCHSSGFSGVPDWDKPREFDLDQNGRPISV